MQKTLLLKAALVALILLLLKGLLLFFGNVVDERQGRQQAVIQEIAASQYGAQVFAGPILSVPYIEEYDKTITVGGVKKIEKRRVERTLRLFPDNLDVRGEATLSRKSRGLFKALLFDWQASVSGEFLLQAVSVPRSTPQSNIIWGQPVLSLTLGDPRGLFGTPTLQWDGAPLAFARGSGLAHGGSGIHALPGKFDPTQTQRHAFTLTLGLRGSDSLSFVPLASRNHIALTSPWPHPSFGGQFLPDPQSQRVTQKGFVAEWQISALASRAQQQFAAYLEQPAECGNPPCTERATVSFIEPINIYMLSERAIKYGLLFILLTFAGFLLFELLKHLPIHPAQYFLIGLAMAVFFLLLIALSEHIAFVLAYLVAAAACILLISIYLSAVLRSVRRGAAFGALLTLLYGVLYGLLASEDNALLLGALLVFAMIALIMLATRKVDWYTLDATKR